jgi:hypothetical protein
VDVTRVVFLIIRMMAVTSTGVIVRRVVRGGAGGVGVDDRAGVHVVMTGVVFLLLGLIVIVVEGGA